MNKIYIYTVLKDSANMVKKDSGKIIKSNNSNKAETV